jgi:hypothetical protein
MKPMKAKITLLALLASAFCAFAQVSPVLYHNNLDNNNTFDEVEDIELYNNEMYYSVPSAGKIVKTSLATPNAPIVDVVTGLTFPSALAVVGNELYFLQTANTLMQPNTGKLCKIDLTAANPAVTTLYSTLQYPIELAMNGSTAYVGETYVTGPVNNFDVDHMELSVVIGSAKTVLFNGYDYIDDLEYSNNNLYIVTFSEAAEQTTIRKLDVTTNTPGTPSLFWTDANGYAPYNAEISGTKMYLNADFSGSAVFQIDLLNPSAAPVLIANSFTFNTNSAYVNEIIAAPGNILYAIGESFDGDEDQYVLYSLNLNSMSTAGFSKGNSISLHPNPATDSFMISNYEDGSSYAIYSIDGKLVKHGIYTSAVSVNDLAAGLYTVQLDNGRSIKLQKQ